MDIFSAIITFVNPILIAIVGYLVRQYMEENNRIKRRVADHDRDIATFKESHQELKDGFKKLDERLRERDQRLIERLTDQLDKFTNKK